MLQEVPQPEAIEHLTDVLGGYDVVLCDVWGVLHNGQVAYPGAISALMAAREAGAFVIMVTNAPRPWLQVRQFMQRLNVPDEICDAIITSGDVTRALIETAGIVAHLGPDKDDTLYHGLSAERTNDLSSAQGVVVTGLRDDINEKPEDYHPLMRKWLEHGLPMICANPDIVVEVGGRLAWCAGALAREYAKLGGQVSMAGKPYAPIYDQALDIAATHLGQPVARERVIAIGDGQPTDVTGANDAGVDLLFISNGIHVAEYGERDVPDMDRLSAFLHEHGNRARYTMPALA
ncbi:MAG: TIGR01459 family HAD-type hydrolase [Pseudomonadota bacterium]